MLVRIWRNYLPKRSIKDSQRKHWKSRLNDLTRAELFVVVEVGCDKKQPPEKVWNKDEAEENLRKKIT